MTSQTVRIAFSGPLDQVQAFLEVHPSATVHQPGLIVGGTVSNAVAQLSVPMAEVETMVDFATSLGFQVHSVYVVTDPTSSIEAAFSWKPIADGGIQFTDESVASHPAGVMARVWRFGNLPGNPPQSNETNPHYVYPDGQIGDSYQVTLLAADLDHNTSQVTHEVVLA